MRKILLYTLMTLAAAGMASCEDFLTRDTYDQIGSDEFWKSETDLELYANGFIQKMIPGDGTITRGDIYADYCAVDIPTDLLRPDGNVSPDNQTGWAESNWTNLRRVNYMLDNMHKCKGRVSDEIYNHYEGVARFWRAWFYYDKVQTFGAVPWYDFTIAASDKEAMMKPRDSREYVMDKVLEDLTFASTYCLSDAKFTKGSALINKWVALAFKSRVCLYEGTFRKYHSREPSSDKPWQAEYNADNKFLREAAAAAKEIMDKGPYSLVTGDVKTALPLALHQRRAAHAGGDLRPRVQQGALGVPRDQLVLLFADLRCQDRHDQEVHEHLPHDPGHAVHRHRRLPDHRLHPRVRRP